MKCEEFSSMLDDYLDDALSAEDIQRLTEHASACKNCGRELKNAKQLRAIMLGMDDAVAVPLETQASWRNAVKAEAKRRKIGRRVRTFAAVAAAAVVLFGSVTLIGNQRSLNMDLHLATTKAAVTGVAESAKGVMLASDGESAATDSAEAVQNDYTCRKKFGVDDVKAAEMIVTQLAGEYDGAAVCELSEADEAIYRVEMPMENMEDFLKSVSVIGDVRDSESRDWKNDPAIIYIHILKA